MNKKIVLSIISIFALVLLLFTTTYAWLTSTGKKENTYTIGKVSYTFNGSFVTKGNTEYIVPGEPLVGTNFSIENASTVASNCRVKVELSLNGTACPLTTNTGLVFTDASNYFLVTTGSATWVLDNGYFYYGGTSETGNGKINANATIPEPAQNIFTSIKLNGATVGNTFATNAVSIKITLQAKQADYVTWADLASTSFNWETGI